MYMSTRLALVIGSLAPLVLSCNLDSEMAATDTKLAKVLLLTTERVLYSPRVFRGVLPLSTRPTLICATAAHLVCNFGIQNLDQSDFIRLIKLGMLYGSMMSSKTSLICVNVGGQNDAQ